MKCKLLSGFAGLALAGAALGQTASFYVNDGIVLCPPGIPPQVNATSFINNNYFNINFTNPFVFNPQQYETANTLNYTNTRYMIGNTGFRFETSPAGSGVRRMAANWNNSGVISAGSVENTNQNALGFLFFGGLPKLTVSATNVVNTGTNVVGVDGLLKIDGRKVDLSRGAMFMEGFEQALTLFANVGIFDGGWGLGTNIMAPNAQFGNVPPSTPFHILTSLQGGGYVQNFRVLTLNDAVAYVNETIFGTNRNVQVVFLNNTNAAISNNVYFVGLPVVEWVHTTTNPATGFILTNYLYLQDSFGVLTNFQLIQNNFSGLSSIAIQPTFQPDNYAFGRGARLFLGNPAPPGLPPGTFDPGVATNLYTAYRAVLAATTQLTNNLPGEAITNLPGRIEITAADQLNLNRARISGLNYLSIKSTNHFDGSSRAQIVSPFTDINLGTTNANGTIAITNLLFPTVPRLSGTIDLWSGRWTNDFGGFNSRYHVLFVDSHLDNEALALVQDFRIRGTNVILSDVINNLRTLLVDAENLTLTTNGPGSQTDSGELNLMNSAITWPASLPRLKNLTNHGTIRAQNAMFFGGSRSTPFFSTNFNEPYLSMINRGQIFNQGSLIWANVFENTGLLSSGIGSITLQSLNAGLTNGFFVATSGDISISSESLVISNHLLQAGQAIVLSVTNLLTDTGTNVANTWFSGRGIKLLHKPAAGDLHGTTLFSTLTPYVEAVNNWAGEDRGCVKEGYTNNAAIGRLILDGGYDSQFTFTGTGPGNAIYIDYLELRNYMTNRDAAGNFIGLQVDPNMKVYFAQAMMGGASIAEKLDQQNGGRFCWVSDYAGFHSGTNVVYPDGTTNYFNAALVGSCNLDSDGDGLVNCSDTTPILRPQDLTLAVSLVGEAALAARVSWLSGPHAANTVYYKTNSTSSTPWQVLTNFATGPVGGRVFITDPVNASSPRYYRVRVDSHHP